MANQLTFKNAAEYQNWLKQNQDFQGSVDYGGGNIANVGPTAAPKPERNFLESLVGGVIDPFVGLSKKGLELGNSAIQGLNGGPGVGDFINGTGGYKNQFLDDEEYGNFKKNAFLDTAKDVAGVGSWFVPGGLIAKGVLGGGLSSFASSDATDWKDLDATKIATDGVIGGAIGGGIGLAGKAFGGLKRFTGKGDDIANALEGQNLGIKFDKNSSVQNVKGDVQNALGQLKAAGKGVNPESLDGFATQKTNDFRDLLQNQYTGKPASLINESDKIKDGISSILDDTADTGVATIDKNIRPSVIRSRLKDNPAFADTLEMLNGTEEALIGMKIDKSTSDRIKGVLNSNYHGTDSSKLRGVDVLAQDLDSMFPGYGLANAEDPADAILEFVNSKNKLKQGLADSYKEAHQELLKADPNYSKQFGAMAETLQTPKVRTTSSSIQDDIQKTLFDKFSLGPDEISASPALQAKLSTITKKIEATGGDPAKLFDLTSELTTIKGLDADITTAANNKIVEAARQYARDKIKQVVPEASDYFSSQAPLRGLASNARTSLNNADKIPFPFSNGGINVPGVGAAVRGTRSAVANTIRGAGNMVDGLSQFAPKVNSDLLTRFGANAAVNMPGAESDPTADPSMLPPSNTGQAPIAQTSQYDPQTMQQMMQLATQQLMLPKKQGGAGLNPEQATNQAPEYLQAYYGISLPSSDQPAKRKLTEGEKKFSAAGIQAEKALGILQSGKADTGFVAGRITNPLGQFLGTQTPNQTAYRANLAAARGSAVSALSGANVPESEYARIAAMIPEETDEPGIARQKLSTFIEAMGVYSSQ